MNNMKLINKQDTSDVVAHDVAPLTVETDSRTYSRMGWGIVLLGFFGFMVWALFAPLDKGVPVTGTLSVDSNRKQVQHQAGGTIDDILVREGDKVKAGQVLVKMNSTASKSNYETSRSQYVSLRATEARLIAERDGAKSVTFPAELVEQSKGAKADPQVIAAMSLQSLLFSTRRGALADELGAIDQSVTGIKAQAQGLREAAESRKEQIKMVKEQLDSLRELTKDGFVARNRVYDVERQYSQLVGNIAEDRGNLLKSQSQVAELALRRTQRMQDYQREVRTLLADVQRDANALASRLTGLEFELNNTLVKSPADGTVVGMAVFTRGGVVSQGFRMMDVVPEGDALVVEGQIPVNLIDKVHPGLELDLNFSAFNQNTTPNIPGKVVTVSADRMTDERTGVPYYTMKAVVTPEGMKKIAQLKLNLRPGMPVDLFVHTGERTMMNYLLKPIIDRAKTSMSEE